MDHQSRRGKKLTGDEDFFIVDDEFDLSIERPPKDLSIAGSRLASLFNDEEKMPTQFRYVAELKAAENSESGCSSETSEVVFAASVHASSFGSETRDLLVGIAVLRFADKKLSQLILYTESKKVLFRCCFDLAFSLEVCGPMVVVVTSNTTKWNLSFADRNTFILFIVTVGKLMKNFSSQGLSINLKEGEGECVNIGDSILFDRINFEENANGKLSISNEISGEKLKLLKRFKGSGQWEHELIGLKRNEEKIIFGDDYTVLITVKKVKFSKSKSAKSRSGSGSRNAEEGRHRSESPEFLSSRHDAESEHHISSTAEERDVLKRISMIGTALPIPNSVIDRAVDAETEKPSSSVDDESKLAESSPSGVGETTVSTALSSPSEKRKREEVIEFETAKQPTPLPRRLRSSTSEVTSVRGFSLEHFYETFLLELDRLHNRMEMSFSRIIHEELRPLSEDIQKIKSESASGKKQTEECLKDVSTKLDALYSSLEEQRKEQEAFRNDLLVRLSEGQASKVTEEVEMSDGAPEEEEMSDGNLVEEEMPDGAPKEEEMVEKIGEDQGISSAFALKDSHSA